MRILWLVGIILTDNGIISVIVSIVAAMPSTKDKVLLRIIASIPVEETMAFPARGESATDAAKDVLPGTILTDFTVTRVPSALASLIVVVVVVPADLQSLLELCHLLLVRTRIKGTILSSAASRSNFHASGSTIVKARLVIISAVAVPPFRSAAIAELCFAATTVVLLAA